MYADRYTKSRINPAALGIAVALNGGIVAALIFASPIVTKTIDIALTATNIPLPDDPPPIPDVLPKPKIEPKLKTQVVPPPPERPAAFDPVAPGKTDFVLPDGPSGLDGGVTGGTGIGPVAPLVPAHVPVLTGAQPDPRFARAFQPDYPAGERRAGNEGRVTVRVLIGVDGRVKQVELVGTASDQFFEATRRQALDKWRFKPATRDGIPQEAWRTMSVSFVLNEDD